MHAYPYHIDALIQMSDTSRMSDDSNMAADLIGRLTLVLKSFRGHSALFNYN